MSRFEQLQVKRGEKREGKGETGGDWVCRKKEMLPDVDRGIQVLAWALATAGNLLSSEPRGASNFDGEIFVRTSERASEREEEEK